MIIRDIILPSDLTYVQDILESTGMFHDFEIATALDICREGLSDGPDSGYFFLFIEEEKHHPIGFAIYGPVPCTKKRYDLYWIGVHQNHRGKGLGKELLKICEDNIRLSGGKRIYIETSTREDYSLTQQFYLKNGYHIESVLNDFYEDGDGKIIFSKRFP
jgi:ribosomal protein S18 acetylase RimI-like enzyme